MSKEANANQPAKFPPESGVLPARNLGFHSASITHTGYVRTVNEDAYLDARENKLWVVADGMGGHSFGDVASRAVVNALVSFRAGEDMAASVRDIETRLKEANAECRRQASGQVMGSTVAALFVHDPYSFFIWAGDSRIYRLRNQRLEQMTEDHSLVQELVSLGEIKREEMERHPSSHIITRAVGVHADLQLETSFVEIEPGDRFLICSDGLFKDLTDAEVEDGLASVTAEDAVQCLTDMALGNGGSDNITAIAVQAEHLI